MKHLVDEPSELRKHHKNSVPTIGGIIIFAATVFSYALWFPWDDLNFYGNPVNFAEAVKEFKFLIAASILIFFIGVKDDIIGVAPVKKLVSHFIVGFILVVMADIRITGMHGVFDIGLLPYWGSVLLSVFTYVVVVNAFNLIDGSDGLAAGVGLITSVLFGIWFYRAYQFDLSLMSAVLAGSLGAFLLFNFSPARIFMGDSGSLFIGALTYAIAVKCIETTEIMLTADFKGVSPPIFAMSVLAYPLVDTLRVFTIRILAGVSPFAADRNHIHHRLIDKGFTHAQTALILYLVCLIVPLICFYFRGVNPDIAFPCMFLISVGIVHATLLLPLKKKNPIVAQV